MNPPLGKNGASPQIVPGESSEIIVAKAIRFLKKVRAEDKPFLIVICFGSPPGPYSGTHADVARYKHLGLPIGARFAEITAMDRATGTFRDVGGHQ